MKFKHAFNVFVDNFSVTYKQLLYRLIIGVIAWTICFLGVYPFIKNNLIGSEQFNALLSGAKDFIKSLLNGEIDKLSEISQNVREAYQEFIIMLHDKTPQFILGGFLLVIIMTVEKWFAGLGNYATAAVINDKMALRANSPFLGTMIRNLKEASIYSAIYVPLSVVFDLAVCTVVYFLVFYLFNSFTPFLLCVFLFFLIIVIAVSVKMTFTTDWLPALIRGKTGQKKAFIYTFSRKNKKTFNVLSNYLILTLIVLGLNVAAFFFTLGVGLLITVPSSFVLILSFGMVNYYDREEIKYFIDKNTIIKPAKERTPTREEFFRGDND